MIKNKYYIGQHVRIKGRAIGFIINNILKKYENEDTIFYTANHLPDYIPEDELEPLPEKQKIVLWQWMLKDEDSYCERWASEKYYNEAPDQVKTGATKEVEI